MPKYNYPQDWRDMTPLERDNFHRRMGSFGRRVRFVEAMCRIDSSWRWRWWDGETWRYTAPEDRVR